MDAKESNAWIGLGSNMGDGPRQIQLALELLQADPAIRVLRCSSLYRTEPWGKTGQDDFTNAVAEIASTLAPMTLLSAVKEIERRMGRLAGGERWGPRPIDLDILLLGDQILWWPGLTVPHPRMHKRSFVLIPLSELEPDLQIPSRGSVRACMGRLPPSRISRLADASLPGT